MLIQSIEDILNILTRFFRDGTDQSPQKYGIHIPSGNKSYEEFEIMLHFWRIYRKELKEF